MAFLKTRIRPSGCPYATDYRNAEYGIPECKTEYPETGRYESCTFVVALLSNRYHPAMKGVLLVICRDFGQAILAFVQMYGPIP